GGWRVIYPPFGKRPSFLLLPYGPNVSSSTRFPKSARNFAAAMLCCARKWGRIRGEDPEHRRARLQPRALRLRRASVQPGPRTAFALAGPAAFGGDRETRTTDGRADTVRQARRSLEKAVDAGRRRRRPGMRHSSLYERRHDRGYPFHRRREPVLSLRTDALETVILNLSSRANA